MARPITETPVLTGKDAAIFVKKMKEQKSKLRQIKWDCSILI